MATGIFLIFSVALNIIVIRLEGPERLPCCEGSLEQVKWMGFCNVRRTNPAKTGAA
jgi:hypothetical protein